MPAEWEVPSAVLLAWPHPYSDWAPMLGEARDCVAAIAAAVTAAGHRVIILTPDPASTLPLLTRGGADGHLVTAVEYTTNDTWARDFGPITVEADGRWTPVDFQFNGWGLKFAADRDNLVNLALDDAGIFATPLQNRRSFILEGGSVDSDGEGTIITTSECLLSPNRNGSSSREEIEAELRHTLGARRVIWLDHGALLGDDTDSHIDTLARFAPGRLLLHAACDNPGDANYPAIQAMTREIGEMAPRHDITPVPLPLPDPVYDPLDGHQLPATYLNFLALPDTVIMPAYGQPANDSRAAAILSDAFRRPVVAVDCRVLVRQHGSLHCMTMQIPEGALNPPKI